ncbi:MAG: EamA family transporter [Clostridia bacterium]|nr:EamA family transporter [Clostridia bacterium]
MKKPASARIMLILSMVIFGTLAPFVRGVAISSQALALCRAVLATVLIGGFLLFTKQKIDFRNIGKELALLLISGAAMGINWILLFEAYKYTTVSVATLSYYFAPVIVTLICPILFKERLTAKKLVCFIFSTLGLVLVIGVTDLSSGKLDIRGVLFGLGAAVFYASVIILNKLIKKVAGLHRTFLQFVGAIVVLLPYVLFTGGISFSLLDLKGYICLAVLGIVHSGIAYCLYFSSLKELEGQQAAILSYIDPLVAVAVSVIVLAEPLSVTQAIGGVLILGFTLYNEISTK